MFFFRIKWMKPEQTHNGQLCPYEFLILKATEIFFIKFGGAGLSRNSSSGRHFISHRFSLTLSLKKRS